MMGRLVPLTLLVVAACACAKSGGKKESISGPGQGAKEPDVGATTKVGAVKMHFLSFPMDASTGDDAVTYTSGTIKLGVVAALDNFAVPEEHKKEMVKLTSKTAAYLRTVAGAAADLATIAEADKALVGKFCSEIVVSATDAFTDHASVTTDLELGFEGVFVGWRSHFSQADKDALSLLLLAKGLELRCGVDIALDWARASASEGITITLDPVPVSEEGIHPASFFAGTADYDTALKEPVMLPAIRDNKAAKLDATWARLDVPAPVGFKRKIKAANAKSITVGATPDAAAAACVLHLTSALRAVDPAATQQIAHAVASDPSLKLKLTGVKTTAMAGGDLSPTCTALAPVVDAAGEPRFTTAITCDQVKLLAEAQGCGYAISVENLDDAANSVVLRQAVSGIKSETIDLGNAVNAEKQIPLSADNPLRPASINMVNFSTAQTAVLAQSFDLWHAVSKPSYDGFFKNHVTDIEYISDATGNCDGAGAYAYLNSTKVFWCPGGGLIADFLPPKPTAHSHVYRAVTALHETLHTLGNDHDIDEPGNAPCASADGTAYSAIIAVDIYKCPDDWCYGFRSAAKAEFITELDYSLKNDGRRFQGVCQQWSELLGVTFTP